MLKGQDLEREPLLPRGSDVASSSTTTTPATSEEVLTAEEKIIEKRLIRKLDLSLLLWAQVFHLLSYAQSSFSWLKPIQIPGVLGEWAGSEQHAYVNS